MHRQDNSALPDNNELSRILSAEVTRDIPTANQNVHFPDFSLFRQLLVYYQISTDILDNQQLDIHGVVSEGSSILNALVRNILANPNAEVKGLLDKAYEYLAEEDTPQKSDLLLVLGSRTPLRAQKAAEIYHRQLADRIVISGGNPIYHSGDAETEAVRYKEILMNSGISEDTISIEDRSITIPDNIRRTLNLLEQQRFLPHSIIIVNSPYAQRRGWAILKKHLPKNVVVYRVNSECAVEYRKEEWYKQEKTLRIILNEFIKMRASVVYNTA